MVVQHGDLKLENVLIDPKTSLINGIIDWDFSEIEGLPLLDLLHLLASRRRVLEKRKLEDIITDVVIPINFSVWEKNIIYRYLDAIGMEKSLLSSFVILYWIHHVVKRIRFEIIKVHPAWLKKNIVDPYNLICSLYLTPKRV
jgi:aminoglycoside phosphotransferase (APT) family kinase protein